MKKFIISACAIIVVLGLVTCAKLNNEPAPPPVPSSSIPIPSSSAAASSAAPAVSSAPVSSSSVAPSTPPPAKAPVGSSIEGSWVTKSVTFESKSYTPEELEESLTKAESLLGDMQKQMDALEIIKTLNMTFEPEGKGTLSCTAGGEEISMPFTWEGQDGSYTLDDGTNPPTALVHYADDTLSYTYGGFELLLMPAAA